MSLNLNKRTIVFIIFFILIILGLVLCILYFRARSQKLNSLYAQVQANLEKETRGISELQGKYNKLQADFEGLTKERDHLAIQVNGLILDRNLARQLEAEVAKNKEQIDSLAAEKQALTDKNLELKNIVEKFKLDQEKLMKGKKKLWDELAREKDVSLLKRTEQEKDQLKKDYDKTMNDLKFSKVKVRELEAAIASLRRDLDKNKIEAQDLSDKLDKMSKRYAAALEQNKKLEQKMIQEPKKYAEVARQNRVLLERTANMHYNMGVFYVKQKEYTRAISEFEKAIELNPRDAYAHFNLGYIYAEHLVSRPKAVEHFRQFIRLAKKTDKDVDWARNYLLTWETWGGKEPLD